jgi:hypothetical protein
MLKQSPQTWYDKFSKVVVSFRYKQSNAYHILFTKHYNGNTTTLIVYVNDIVVTENDNEEITMLNDYLV